MDLEGSWAFREAMLRSERARTIAVLAVLAVAWGFLAIRSAGSNDRVLALSSAGFLLLLTIFEVILLLVTQRRLRDGRTIPGPLLASVILLETMLPTAGVWFQARSPEIGPVAALLAPSIVLYFLFILLSVLRLRPHLPLIAGTMSAIGHLSLVLRAFETAPVDTPLPRLHYYFFAPGLFVFGALAAAVTKRVRRDFEAALRETETRRQLEELEREFTVAKQIQASLLPRESCRATGHEIYGWTRPATHTGGDYFDWLQLPDGTISFSIADVTGHGLGPTLVTVGCRAYARASFGRPFEPARTIERVNDLLLNDLDSGKFVTFALGKLDPSTGVVEIFSAGHGPIVHISPSKESATFLRAGAPPLGITPLKLARGPERIELARGDSLVLATDGFHEWQRADREVFGYDRLERSLLASARLSPQEMVAALLAAVERFGAGTPQADDLTAVVVRRS